MCEGTQANKRIHAEMSSGKITCLAFAMQAMLMHHASLASVAVPARYQSCNWPEVNSAQGLQGRRLQVCTSSTFDPWCTINAQSKNLANVEQTIFERVLPTHVFLPYACNHTLSRNAKLQFRAAKQDTARSGTHNWVQVCSPLQLAKWWFSGQHNLSLGALCNVSNKKVLKSPRRQRPM